MPAKGNKAARVRRTVQQIEQLVARFHRGSQTIDQFARQQGVAISTVARWLRTQRQCKAPRLVEVQCEPGFRSTRIGQLRLSKGLLLELERGFDVEPVARLVQLLEGR